MEKRFVVLTSPRNEKILTTAPKEFYASLKELFEENFNHQNTHMITNPLMSDSKMHVFENSDYIGWFLVIPEGSYHEPTAKTTKH